MKKKIRLGLPHVVAVIIFFVLGAIYFAPQFNGYDLNQSDIRQYQGMSKEISDFRQTEHAEPLWTNSAFGGMPAYQISMVNSNLMTSVEDNVVFRFFKAPLGYLVIAMLSFYILLLCFKVNPWLAMIGAIAYGFSTIFMLYLEGGHNSKVHAIALLPGIVGSIIYGYRYNFRIGGLLLCVFLCLHLSANHIQETYYLIFLIVAIVTVEGYRFFKQHQFSKFIKISTFLLCAAIIGIIPIMSNLLLTNEYGKYTNRGNSDLTISVSQTTDNSEARGLDRDYIKQYSLGFGEVWSLAIPDIKGGASNRLGNLQDKLSLVAPENQKNIVDFSSYWGEQSGTGGAFYFGATIFLLFILGMVFLKDNIKWAFFFASLLAIVLSWKYSAILDVFIDYVPLFNKFRDTKMMLVLAQISFPLVGLLFLNQLVNTRINQKKLIIVMGTTVGLFLLFYWMPTVWFSFFSLHESDSFNKMLLKYPDAVREINTIKADVQLVRVDIFRDDVLRSIFFMMLVGSLIIFYLKTKLPKNLLILSIGVLVLIDLWSVDKRYLNNDPNNQNWIKTKAKNSPFQPSVADIQILNWEMNENKGLREKINQNMTSDMAFSTLNLATDYRVFSLDNPFADASTSYYHKSVGGYHAAKLKRFVELTDFRLNKEYAFLVHAVQNKNDTLLQSVMKDKIPVLNMLNTKYIIYNSDTLPLRNPYANGSAWIAENIVMVTDANAEIKALDTINPAKTAVVDQSFRHLLPQQHRFDPMATIRLVQYRPNHITYQSNITTPQIGLFSEIYYKDGWNAYVDGQLSTYFRADYVLRAMTLPAGHHTIDFKFEPKTYYWSRKLSVAGSALILLLTAGVLFYEIRQRNITG